MPKGYVEEILRARVYDVAVESDLTPAVRLGARLKNNILYKREDEQQVFSFKLRGAYNKIVGLPDEEKARGVIAASAGNHAQGVALAGQKLGIATTIVMPTTTPGIKVDTVRRLGGKAVLHGDSFDEANEYAHMLAEEKGLTFIYPFDDPKVIAGQGTVGMEILRQHPEDIEAIFVPVGGGGLIAGVAAFVKQIRPSVKVIGVEPEDAPTLHDAMKAGRRVVLKQVGLFADGVAVKQIGKETFRVAKDLVDEVILVSTDQICAAIKDIFDDTRSVSEPAGALAVAGIKKYGAERDCRDKTLVGILSGANINFDRLRHVAERAEVGENREALLAVQIPERPGAFLQFCKLLGKRSITEFNYRYADDKDAQVFCGVEMRGGQPEREELIKKLEAKGYAVVDMTENETAKLHIRYMVGGHAPSVKDEHLYRFIFPERPGALLDFLSGMTRGWNISLFHYRNHGAAYGRVLVGVQLDSKDQKAFEKFMRELGYTYHDEKNNPAYKLFASAGE